jgi:hypothetical protein
MDMDMDMDMNMELMVGMNQCVVMVAMLLCT